MSSPLGFAASIRQTVEQNRLEPVGELAGLEQEHEQEHGQVELAGHEQNEQVELAGLEHEQNEQEEGGACLEPGHALDVPLRAPEPWMIGATMAKVSWFWGGDAFGEASPLKPLEGFEQWEVRIRGHDVRGLAPWDDDIIACWGFEWDEWDRLAASSYLIVKKAPGKEWGLGHAWGCGFEEGLELARASGETGEVASLVTPRFAGQVPPPPAWPPASSSDAPAAASSDAPAASSSHAPGSRAGMLALAAQLEAAARSLRARAKAEQA